MSENWPMHENIRKWVQKCQKVLLLSHNDWEKFRILKVWKGRRNQHLEFLTHLTPQSQRSKCNLPVPNVSWRDAFDKWFANFNFKGPPTPKEFLFLNSNGLGVNAASRKMFKFVIVRISTPSYNFFFWKFRKFFSRYLVIHYHKLRKLRFGNHFIIYQKCPFKGRIVPGRLHSELCAWGVKFCP